jgi:Cu2+-exporting ATPase
VAGDEVVVYPGEIIPVDGEIIDGHAMIDQKTITGEGLPVMRAKGEAVFAATVIRDGQLTARAIRVGSFTTAGQIARLVESAPIGDTRMQNHAEKLADVWSCRRLRSRQGRPPSRATSIVSCRS